MSEREVDAVVWCPQCKVVKFTVYRVPSVAHGVYHHVTEPAGAHAIKCECGAQLERKS